MPRVSSNDIEIYFETIGSRVNPPLLLIGGLGAQLSYWGEDFLQGLAARGYWVIVYDNRDVGLSTKLDRSIIPDIAGVFAGASDAAPYSLDDMADDAAGLLDAIGIDKAHVVGVSMGSMIAQLLAISHPDRVASLALLMTTTGRPEDSVATPEALEALMQQGEPEDDLVATAVDRARIVASPAFAFDEERVRARIGESMNRSFYPLGRVRQLAAILAAWDRTDALREIRVPTVVINGDADPLIRVTGGRAVAAAIPDSRLLVIPGMGHDLPVEAWSQIFDAIANNASRAGL